MKPTLKHPPTLLLIPILTAWCAGSALAATPELVMESNQSPLDGSMKNGGSAIGDVYVKAVSFTSGTSALELVSVDLGLLRNSNPTIAVDGNYQINFNLYSASATGEPQTLLYTTSFTPYLTGVSAWFSLPISYTLSASTPYAFGLVAPTAASAITVKWANTTNSIWPPLTSHGYAGIGVTNGGFALTEDTNGVLYWQASVSDNAFRLYAVPETSAGLLPGLGLGLAAVGVHQLRRRRNR